MACSRREDDDGRVVADMSGIEGPRLLLPRMPGKRRDLSLPPPAEEEEQEARPWEKDRDALSPKDRRLYVFAALKAALLIGAVFLICFGLFIALLLWLWL